MEAQPCPKCNEPMDDGLLSVSSSAVVGYISKKQTGMIKTVTQIKQTRACPNCGYVEMYLDPQELKSRIS